MTETKTVDVQDHFLKNEAAKRANADPLPGSAGDAFGRFGPIPIAESGISVREVVASDWKIMKAVDSPIIRLLMEIRQNPKNPTLEITDDEQNQLALHFTRTPKELRAILADGGKEKFFQMATDEIGDKLSGSVVRLITATVIEQVRRSFSTAVSYREKMEKEGDVRFFLDSGTSPETDSAGG